MIEPQNVMSEDWDILIILDACRYDYFEEIYRDYLEGELEKKDSGAGATPEWLNKKFERQMNRDISYFSANPFVNSYGLSLNKVGGGDYSWNAKNIFGHIVDVWDMGFDDKHQTILPETMFHFFESKPHLDRVILHFMQPHYPYLHPHFERKFSHAGLVTQRNRIKEEDNEKKEKNNIKKLINRIFRYDLKKFLPKEIQRYKVRKMVSNNFFYIQPKNGFEEAFRKYTLDKMREFYKYSLSKALKVISKNIHSLDGKLVITSDHGECFGEKGRLAHSNGVHIPTLTEVPWLEID